MVACPKCDAEIDVEEDELDVDETITCDECGRDWQVVSLNPLELELFEADDDEEGDDFDEDEDEEFPK